MKTFDCSEDALVEQPAIALFGKLGYSTANCFNEQVGTTNSTLGRETTADVVLVPKLRAALQKLNPDIANDAIQLAIEELTKDRSAMSLAQANREIYKLLKDGVRVSFQDEDGSEAHETVTVIDWNEPTNNDFFLASQFWVTGSIYKRRADLVGFVNGLPLVFIELKKSHGRLEHAFKNNLRDYKSTIPQLFWYNAFIILSNGSQAEDRQHDGGLGTLFRLEADQQRRRKGRHLAGNHDSGNVREDPVARSGRELHRFRRDQGRAD